MTFDPGQGGVLSGGGRCCPEVGREMLSRGREVLSGGGAGREVLSGGGREGGLSGGGGGVVTFDPGQGGELVDLWC